jgi:hypothetical protein
MEARCPCIEDEYATPQYVGLPGEDLENFITLCAV